MKLSAIIGFISAVHAATTSYIITIEQTDVPSSFLDSLKEKVHDVGGYVTHEFSLIKGFTAELDDTEVSKLQGQIKQAELKSGYSVHIEKDSEVHTFARHEH
ncbi:hypothetical protein ZYGR_0Z02170 [Zygosaccharomyces rouxii]|uniref:ZYRO0G05302p n=2 Tax=Zygosaccharomyces rouxii TaxID=4956 RepID=C5DZL0_ZYGRC|nr:uncharacterized protein ZYRO0G05302g [Zygosaccharomyces rouxii]KAH9202293.1 hypothetical protein LQ764DRAFT_5335 [Zygosaccharomyces rouxii]GAV50794.1 hypothetical protein ZYGR_0Z02170 [Zygosaccharomyces rouxii]CAR29294.1 ZYRO0G05302p [Zygosaccharomyces rouxii]